MNIKLTEEEFAQFKPLDVKIVDNHDIIGIDAKHLWNNSENFKSIKINKSIEL